MRLERIFRAVYCEPWLVDAPTHASIRRILASKMAGETLTAAMEADKTGKSSAASQASSRNQFGKPLTIAVIPIYGVIGKRMDSFEKSCTGGTDVLEVMQAVNDAAADDSVSGIFLDVDSPGGTVGGVADLGNAVAEARKRKPVMAYADGLMASAAYWISSGASMIYANASAEVGSIGVYLPWIDETAAMQMEGVKVELIKNEEGTFKGMGFPGTSLTLEQRANLQESVQSVFYMFRDHILAHRPDVDLEAMRGQTFLGKSPNARSAVDVGLADSVATREQAFDDLIAYI